MKLRSSGSLNNRRWIIVLRALISLILLVILFSQVDWAEFYRVLTDLKPIYLLVPILGFYINIALSSYKWQAILAYFGIEKKMSKLLSIYTIGVYFNNFLPTSIGGDGYRFLKVRGEHSGASDRILSSIVLERGYGYLTLILINLILLLRYWEILKEFSLLFWIELAILGMVILLVLIAGFGKSTINRLTAWWRGFQFAERALQLLTVRDARTIAVSLFTSLLFIIISGIGLDMYFRAAGETLNWLYALYVMTIIGIIGIAPITLNGLGLTELILATLLGLVGISIDTVLAVALLQRVITLLLSLPGAVLYFRQGATAATSLEGNDGGSG